MGVGWFQVSGFRCRGGFDGKSAALKDVGVDHGGFDVLMTEQFLDGANIIAILQEMSCEGVAESVR